MAKSLTGLRVLLLEDEFLIAMDVEQTCRDFGADDIQVAHSVEMAETLLAGFTFDVAIVDIMMSGVSTLDFAGRLRDQGMPFVFASGYTDFHEIEGSFPGVRIVTKPYGGDDLIDALCLAIGNQSDLNDHSPRL